MKRQNLVLVATLAAGALAMGQEPAEERIELKVISPEGAQVLHLQDAMDPLDEAFGSVVLGVEAQDSGEKGVKAKKQDDGTIVREIDLGDGRKMKIVISTDVRKDAEPKHAELPRRSVFQWKHPEMRVQEAPEMKQWAFKMRDPHGFETFDVKALGEDVREHLERALAAFDRAREEFIRAYEEQPGKERVKVRAPDVRTLLRKHGGDVVIETQPDGKPKARAKVEHKGDVYTATKDDVQLLDVTPGAKAKHAAEIQELRKEIAEIKEALRALKEAIAKDAK